MPAPILSYEDLGLIQGEGWLFRGLNLYLGERDRLALIGRNGAGKTTLMRSIMGILPCRRGTMTFDGRSLVEMPPHRRASLGIGYMPEDRRMIPSLTAEENVLVPAWATASQTSAERLARIYRIIPEAEAFAPRKGLQLSGGQQKIAALARALMCGTRLLLLDEPFEGVAPVLCQRLAEVIAQLKQEGVSVMLSESGMTHSRDMLDLVFAIDRGEIRQAA